MSDHRPYSIISRNRESLVGLLLFCVLGSLIGAGGEIGPSRSSLASTKCSDSSSLVTGLTFLESLAEPPKNSYGDRGVPAPDLLTPLFPAIATSLILVDRASRLVALSLARRVSATPPMKPLSSGGLSPAAERPRGREKRDLNHSFTLCVGEPASLGERGLSLPLWTSVCVLILGWCWLPLREVDGSSTSSVVTGSSSAAAAVLS